MTSHHQAAVFPWVLERVFGDRMADAFPGFSQLQFREETLKFGNLFSSSRISASIPLKGYMIWMSSFVQALDSLGFGSYKEEARAVLQEAKAVATSKRQKRCKLENLGIPEEELLRQQQELFAKVFPPVSMMMSW